jgi:N-acylneuraminate cytidylyltransferase
MPRKANKIKVIIFDFDGVLTDNRVLVFDDGHEAVLCNRTDGLFMGLLRERGYVLFIVSKEQNPVVTARGRKLKVEVKQGVDDKVSAVEGILVRQGVTPNEVAYVGNDINDLGAMSIVGLPVAVGDAHPAVKRAAKRVLKTVGGAGVAREVFESVLREPLPKSIRG